MDSNFGKTIADVKQGLNSVSPKGKLRWCMAAVGCLVLLLGAAALAQEDSECQVLAREGPQCEVEGCRTPPAYTAIQTLYGTACYDVNQYQCPAPCQTTTYDNATPVPNLVCVPDNGWNICKGDQGLGPISIVREERRSGYWLTNVNLPECTGTGWRHVPIQAVL
jgi:hypothetical protein